MRYGRLGDGTTANRVSPTALALTGGWDTTSFKFVSLGITLSCGIRASDDRVFCWGFNGDGQLGDGTTISRSVPTALMAAGPRTLLVATTEGLWRPLRSVNTTTSCEAAYADGGDARVIMLLPDGGALNRLSSRLQTPTPRQGALTYNAGLKRLQVCDGNTWYTLGQ